MTEEKKTEGQEDEKAVTPKKKKRSIFKLCLKVVGVLFILLVIGVVILTFTYDKIVSKAVSTVGSHLTGTEVKLESFPCPSWKGKLR